MSRIARKTAAPLDQLIREYLRSGRLRAGLNTRRIYAAWDAASGAGRYTSRRYFRDGRLYITLDSTVVRSQLSFRRKELLDKINALLAQDELFIPDDARTDFVQELILK